MWNEIFDGIGEKLLPTKAAPIASPHLLIIHWPLSWYSLSDDCDVLNFGRFNGPKKKFKLHTIYFWTSEQIKPLQPVGQAAEFKFESKFEPLPVIWKSLPKAIPEDNRRFWLLNQWTSSWGCAPEQLGRVGEMTSGIILNRLQPKFAPDRSQMKCNLPQERASAQIRINQHSDFRWQRAKAWKWCLAWLWNDCNQSLQSNRSQMKCIVWKQCSDHVDRTTFNFWFEDFLSNLSS